jgi:hypothetical protein
LWNSAFFKKKPEIPLFTPKNGLSAFYPIPHSAKSKNIPWNSARGIRFLPPSDLSGVLNTGFSGKIIMNLKITIIRRFNEDHNLFSP